LICKSDTLFFPEIIDNILGLAKINSVKRCSHLDFHIFNETANVGEVGLVFVDRLFIAKFLK